MDDIVLSLADRLAAASEVLSHLASKDGRVAELMRLREALERIAAMGGEAAEEAQRALRWSTQNS